MSLDPIGDRIAEIDTEIRTLREERARLDRLHGRPGVDVVLVYWRHGREVREQSRDTLEDALRYLAFSTEGGHMAAVGVEVNGVLVEDWEEFSDAL